jgi:hypothetical protein
MVAAFAVVGVAAILHGRGVPSMRSVPAPVAALAPPPMPESALRVEAAIAADPATRHAFVHAARARDLRVAARALAAVAERDPAALRELDVSAAGREVLLSAPPDPSVDEALDALAKGGSAGLDLLYAVVERRGGSRMAARATELLRRPEVLEAASPELKIAFTLRDAPCADKLAHLDEAVQGGDGRALIAMEAQGRSCYPRNQALETAILALRARLKR